MSIADSVVVNISVSLSAAPSVQALNTPLIAAYHTLYAARQKSYSGQGGAGLLAMIADGFTVNSAAYKAAAILCSQQPSPANFIIGKRTLKPQQTLTLTMTDATAGDSVNFTIVGSTGVATQINYTIPGSSTTTSVATAVAALISAIPSLAATIGTVTPAVAVITLARTDGLLTDIQGWLANGLANVQLADTTADPGIATDLAAIAAAGPGAFYGVVLDSNSAAEITGAAAWVEATGQGGKFGFFNNSDFNCVNGGSTADIFSTQQVLGHKKCHIQYNGSQLLSYAGASAAAWALVRNPGSYAMAQNMTLPGVPADTDVTLPEAQALIINAHTASSPTTLGKGGNYYKVTASLLASFWGYTPSGQFADVTIFIDWLQVNMQADVFAVIAGLPKVPFTNLGIGLIVGAIDTRLRIGASPAFNGIDGTQPITVTAPSAQSVDNTDKVARNLPNVAWSAFLSGAIETTVIQGTLIN